MNRAYNKGVRLNIAKKLSNFEEHAENFYSDKTIHFYNMGFHAICSIMATLQRNGALFLV
jgi:7-keto-8-aminopelargonate synthetase-like enzyme